MKLYMQEVDTGEVMGWVSDSEFQAGEIIDFRVDDIHEHTLRNSRCVLVYGTSLSLDQKKAAKGFTRKLPITVIRQKEKC